MFNSYDDLITVVDLQEILGIGKNTAYELLKQKKIKAFRIGRTWKIPKKSVEEFILFNTETCNKIKKKSPVS